MASAVKVLGITGGVIGALIGILGLVTISYVITGYADYSGSRILFSLLAIFWILAFSILGALGAAQKLDARPKVNVWALFIAGIVVLLCLLSLAIAGGTTPGAFIIAVIFAFIGLVIGVLFFLSGFLLLRQPAS